MEAGRSGWAKGAGALVVVLGCALSIPMVQRCSEEPEVEPKPRPNILLISLDTLRADHLGCYGYDPYDQPVSPTIDALAAESLRFERMYTPRGQTLPSLASMMTGYYPSIHGIRENGHTFVGGDQPTLAERLGRVGYRTAAYVSILPGNLNSTASAGPARGFEVYDNADGAMVDMAGSESVKVDKNDWDRWVADRGIEYLRQQGQHEEPYFLWLHMYSIHRPYTPPRAYHPMFAGDYDGELRPPPDAPIGERRMLDVAVCERTLAREPFPPDDHAYVVSQYDGGVRYYDDLVADILLALEASGEAEDTILILTSDHGEELGDHHDYWYHGNSMFDSTLRIPMLIRWPGEIEPGVHDGLAQNVDLVPTMLDLLGLDRDEAIEGESFARSLLSGARGRGDGREACYFEWQDLLWAVRTERWKYISNPHKAHPKKMPYTSEEGDPGFPMADEELYDLAEDPGETANKLGATEVAPTDALRAMLGAYRGREGQVQNWNGIESADALEQLRRLGYVPAIPGRPDVYFRGED